MRLIAFFSLHQALMCLLISTNPSYVGSRLGVDFQEQLQLETSRLFDSVATARAVFEFRSITIGPLADRSPLRYLYEKARNCLDHLYFLSLFCRMDIVILPSHLLQIDSFE